MDRGPARPIALAIFPGPPHPGPPCPSNFQNPRPGRAQPMTLAARPMRPGLYTGWTTQRHGPARALDGPDHGPAHVLPPTKYSEYALPYIFWFFFPVSRFFSLFWTPSHAASGSRIATHVAHMPSTDPILLHQRSSPIETALAGRPPPIAAAAAPAATASAPPAPPTPAAIYISISHPKGPCITPPAILSVGVSKTASAPVLKARSTTTRPQRGASLQRSVQR